MRKAFTLIEVMVVLSILAIIAILAFNFFGSTMKDAVEKKNLAELHRGLHILANGYEEYYRKHGEWPQVAQDWHGAALVSDGILKSTIHLPEWTYDNGGPANVFPNGGYATRNADLVDYGNVGGTAAPDIYISVRINDFGTGGINAACKTYNAAYTDIGGGAYPIDNCSNNLSCCMTLTKYSDPYIVYPLELR